MNFLNEIHDEVNSFHLPWLIRFIGLLCAGAGLLMGGFSVIVLAGLLTAVEPALLSIVIALYTNEPPRRA